MSTPPRETDPLLRQLQHNLPDIDERQPLQNEEEEIPTGFVEEARQVVVDAIEGIQEVSVEAAKHVVGAATDVVDAAADVVFDVRDVIVDTAGDVSTVVVDELMDMADAFIDELHEADEEEDKTFLLEMGLTRNLSIIPVDIVHASEQVPSVAPIPNPDIDHAENESKMTDIEAPLKTPEVEGTPLSAYILLASAVISLSSIGPILDLQRDVDATMKVYWRTSATSLMLLPFAVNSLRVDGIPKLTHRQWVELFLAAFSYASMCVFFVWALDFTAVGNALIFSNSQSILLLLGKFFVGERISVLEAAGAIIAFTGATLCSKDSADSAPAGGMKAILGDFYALLSAIGGVAYLVFAKTVRPYVNLYVFMFLIMFIGSLMTLLFMIGHPISFDFDVSQGMFGWLHYRFDRLPLELIMVVVCNLFGAMGYVRAMHYFDNLVISVAALLEPVVAELLAFMFGVGFLPGWKGWLGNALVAGGTFAVVYQPPHTRSTGGHGH